MKFCKNIMARSVAWVVALAATTLAPLTGCSSDSHVAGNSAETGSPELAGLLLLDGGMPAAHARVQCVPQNFDAVTGAELPSTFKTETDINGAYRLDSIPAGFYALEAYHEESGKRLLVRNIEVDSSSVDVSDTLFAPGAIDIALSGSVAEGTNAVVVVHGSTILRNVVVQNGKIFVDSLPADTLPIAIYFDELTVEFGNHAISPNDTLRVPLEVDLPKDTLKMSFVAPLVLPKGVDTLTSFVSNIPLALRLTPENCDFDSLANILTRETGRWNVVRVSKDGSRSKMLPIAKPYLDTNAKVAVIWVNVDSLNVADSLELSFNSAMSPAYATDVFPTNRSYAVVYHFDSGLSTIEDAAEKGYYAGSATGATLTEGVVGRGIALDVESAVVAENSADFDSTRKVNMALDTNVYFCFSLWLQLESLDKEQTVFEKPMEYALRFVPDRGFVVEFYYVSKNVEKTVDTTSYIVTWASGLDGVEVQKWIFIAFNRRNNQVLFFVNDSKIEATAEFGGWDGERGTLQDFKIGGFVGKMDELMLGTSFRDESWTRLTYLNQKPVDYWPTLLAR